MSTGHNLQANGQLVEMVVNLEDQLLDHLTQEDQMHLLIHYQHLLLGLVMPVVKDHHKQMEINLAVAAVAQAIQVIEDIPTQMVKVVMEHLIM